MRYLALGDSYTIGEGLSAGDRWPALLARRLRGRGVPLQEPEIIATTGWTTDELAAAIDAADPQPPFDLVSLLIGVNNQYRGRSVTEFESEFRALLARAVAFADGRRDRTVVLTIPDWSATPFARDSDRDLEQMRAEMATYNAVVLAVCEDTDVRCFDITPSTREHADAVVDDGLHPDASVHAAWVDLIEADVAALLERAGD
ncbi:MAG: SGNH/GDSL hydrolase family protein [Pseudomonadota bacterium]